MIAEQYNILWATSWIAFYPSIISLYNKKYALSLATGSVFITSLLYWRKPANNWKRILDIYIVKMCLLYQIYYAYKEDKILPYSAINILSISCYYYGYYYYYLTKQYWTYTYFHFVFHILANVGNIYLSIN